MGNPINIVTLDKVCKVKNPVVNKYNGTKS